MFAVNSKTGQSILESCFYRILEVALEMLCPVLLLFLFFILWFG